MPHAEEITAIAELPDYPPRRFAWRRRQYRVVKTERPERIAREWWPGASNIRQARDYYVVKDEHGRWFWLYREGPYPAPEKPRWLLHGLFL